MTLQDELRADAAKHLPTGDPSCPVAELELRAAAALDALERERDALQQVLEFFAPGSESGRWGKWLAWLVEGAPVREDGIAAAREIVNQRAKLDTRGSNNARVGAPGHRRCL